MTSIFSETSSSIRSRVNVVLWLALRVVHIVSGTARAILGRPLVNATAVLNLFSVWVYVNMAFVIIVGVTRGRATWCTTT